MNHVEYMDILIFQLEKLIDKANRKGLKLDDKILRLLQKWFEERIHEINRTLASELCLEIEAFVGNENSFWSILKLFGTLKAGVTGTKERADTIRQVFKNRFSDFAQQFNRFVEEVAVELRKEGKARDILLMALRKRKQQNHAKKSLLMMPSG